MLSSKLLVLMSLLELTTVLTSGKTHDVIFHFAKSTSRKLFQGDTDWASGTYCARSLTKYIRSRKSMKVNLYNILRNFLKRLLKLMYANIMKCFQKLNLLVLL